MARRRDIPWGLWLGCLAAACLSHALLVVPPGSVLARSLRAGYEPRPSEEEALALELVELPDEREPEPFVELDRANDRRPSDSRRISERDADFERETKAPPAPERGAPAVAGTRPGQPTSAEPRAEQEQGSEELVEAPDGSEPGSEAADVSEPTPAELADWSKLGGSPGMLHDSFGAAGRPEHLPEVENGRESLLDSKAHLYASFFRRMRGRILEHWDAQAAIDRHDPRGRALGETAKTTVVLVRVGQDGGIEGLGFERESGVDYLDAEAVRALKAAGPFPNPPAGLFGEAGVFVMTVAFVVEPDGSARMFRYSN